MPPLFILADIVVSEEEGERWAGGGEGELLGVNSNPA